MSTMQHITPGKSQRCHQASWVFRGASGDLSSACRNHRAFPPQYHTQNFLQRAHSQLCAGGVPGQLSQLEHPDSGGNTSTVTSQQTLPSPGSAQQHFGSHRDWVCSLSWENQALLFFPFNSNQGKRDVPAVRKESRRVHKGAHNEVLLSFMFQVSHELGHFIRIADEDLKLLRTVQFLAKLDSNCSGLLWAERLDLSLFEMLWE